MKNMGRSTLRKKYANVQIFCCYYVFHFVHLWSVAWSICTYDSRLLANSNGMQLKSVGPAVWLQAAVKVM